MRVLTSLFFLLRWYKSIKLTRHKQNDTTEKAINKSIIMMQYEQSNYWVILWRNKGKESCSNWSFNTGFLICKEGSDDVNNFTKIFAHILNFKFHCLYYIVKILVNYSINAWLHFTNNNLHGRTSLSTNLYKPTHQTSLLI